MLASKTEKQSQHPKTHLEEEETWLWQVVLWPPHVCHVICIIPHTHIEHTHTPHHTYTQSKILEKKPSGHTWSLLFYIIALNRIKGGRSHLIIVTPQAGDLFFSVCVNTSKTNTHFPPLLSLSTVCTGEWGTWRPYPALGPVMVNLDCQVDGI